MSHTRKIEDLFSNAKAGSKTAVTELMNYNSIVTLEKTDQIMLNIVLGQCYLHGYGVPSNKQIAYAKFSSAAELGDAYATRIAAYMVLIEDVKCDKQKISSAIKELQKQAKEGQVEAIFYLGLCLFHGYGMAKNSDEALTYLEKAADLHYVPAMYELGKFFTKKPSPETAASWFYNAISQKVLDYPIQQSAVAELRRLTLQYPNSGPTIYLYAKCLFEGREPFLKQNKQEAYRLFEIAAKQKFSLAQIMLGHRYAQGDGVKVNIYKAAEWYFCAAQRATPETLQVMNPVAALEELAKISNPHDRVLRNLAKCYQEGFGVNKSLETAITVLRRRAQVLFEAMRQNVLTNYNSNLYIMAGVYFAIYKKILQNHLALLRNQQVTLEIQVLLPILQSIDSIDMNGLIVNRELREELKKSRLCVAKDLTTLIQNYEILQLGIKRVAQQTKTYLLALKEKIPKTIFYIANWKFGYIPGAPEFTQGIPSGVKEILESLADLNETSGTTEVRNAWLKILDILEKRQQKKRHDTTTCFYNDTKSKLLECRLFTSVAETTASLVRQHSSPCAIPDSLECENAFSHFVEKGSYDDSIEGSPLLSPLSTNSIFPAEPAAPQVHRQPTSNNNFQLK